MRTVDGRYRLDCRIGAGGMSEVWQAHDQVLDRPVAIKLITLPYHDPDAGCVIVDQVRTEARSAARLAHPNIAGVHDFGMADVPDGEPSPYIVMELVEGQTLASHLRSGALDWRIAVRVCAEVSAALAAAHLHGIVHRDMKPANVLLTPAGVKVLDFGIAAAVGHRDSLAEGEVIGTPAFVAPERLNGVAASAATDVYSVGVLLYLCLAGRLPWPVRTTPDRPLAHVYRTPEPLPEIDGLPDDVAELCLRCLSADPDQRPSSVAVALLLAAAVDAQVYVPVTAVPVPASASRRKPRSTWDEDAAEAATQAAPIDADTATSVARAVGDPVTCVGNGRVPGRHRA